MTSNGNTPRIPPRGKIAVLTSGTWLYGSVSRAEFSRAIGPNENHPTFRLSKQGWRAGRSSVIVVGSHVAAWDWLSPEPARRKRVAKPRRVTFDIPTAIGSGHPLEVLTDEQRSDLRLAIHDLDADTLVMLCIAAGVERTDDLTQATLPGFREALAAHMAGVR